MKYICKNIKEPDNFKRWKKRNKVKNWDKFSKEAKPVKDELQSSLIKEQLRMCCYCEEIISPENSHIEHLKPKAFYKKFEFSYKNLIASCNKKDSCGEKKHGWYAPEMVSPLDENCSARFAYTGDGRIIPFYEEDEWASRTIEKLGLNSLTLKKKRKDILVILEYYKGNDNLNYLQELLDSTIKGEKVWTKGFYTLLVYIKDEFSV